MPNISHLEYEGSCTGWSLDLDQGPVELRGGGGAQLRGGGGGEEEGQEEVVGSHNRSDELVSMQRRVRTHGGDDRSEERYEYEGESLKHFFGSGGGRRSSQIQDQIFVQKFFDHVVLPIRRLRSFVQELIRLSITSQLEFFSRSEVDCPQCKRESRDLLR